MGGRSVTAKAVKSAVQREILDLEVISVGTPKGQNCKCFEGLAEVGSSHSSDEACESRWSEGDDNHSFLESETCRHTEATRVWQQEIEMQGCEDLSIHYAAMSG